MPSDSPVKFTEAKLHSADGKEEYDIRSGTEQVDYYEDLLSVQEQLSLLHILMLEMLMVRVSLMLCL